MKVVLSYLALLLLSIFLKESSGDKPTRGKIKWVFALLVTKKTDPMFLEMARVAVRSAIKFSNLQPVCIVMNRNYDDQIEFLDWIKSQGVILIHYSPQWAQQVAQLVRSGHMKKNIRYSPLYKRAIALVSTFLRIDIPILPALQNDDYIIYADVDIIFLREISIQDFGVPPKYFTMAVESKITDDLGDFAKTYGNAGIMLYNMKNMRATYESFLDFVFINGSKTGLHYGMYGPADQGAYNAFYRQNTSLAGNIVPGACFNWRPYWEGSPSDGKSPAIVHWQGPKPINYISYKAAAGVLERKHRNFKDIFEECNLLDTSHACWMWNKYWMSLASGNYSSEAGILKTIKDKEIQRKINGRGDDYFDKKLYKRVRKILNKNKFSKPL